MLQRSVLARGERLRQCQLARVRRLGVRVRRMRARERRLAVRERRLERGDLAVNEAPQDGGGRTRAA